MSMQQLFVHGSRPGRLASSPDWRLGQPATSRLLAFLVATSLISFGCGAPGNLDDSRAASVLIVQSVLATSDPFGDILSSSGSIFDDVISVDFTAHLKQATGAPGAPTEPVLQDILVERYEVTFTRTDGGSAVPRGFQRAMNTRVRLTGHDSLTQKITTASLVVLPATSKSQPPLFFLIDPGHEPETGFINLQLTAHIRFLGRTIAGHEVVAEGAIGINVANWAD